MNPAAVDRPRLVTKGSLVEEIAGAVRRGVILDRPVIEVLRAVGEEDPQLLGEPTGLSQQDLVLDARELGSEPDRKGP